MDDFQKFVQKQDRLTRPCFTRPPVIQPFLDTAGCRIQAHGGCVWVGSEAYYWYGEHRVPKGASPYGEDTALGVSCYRSEDLYTWQYLGLVFARSREKTQPDLQEGFVLERPKVLRNPRTGHFVLWFHVDAFGMLEGRRRYVHARAGVAISRTGPQGPFAYLGSFRPGEQESRDLTLFQDEEGDAYLVFSGDRNRTLFVMKLAEDYLSPVGEARAVLPGLMREAPAMFKDGGYYYLLTSGCTGWEPNEALLHRALRLEGPWENLGNPFKGHGAERSYGTQGAHVFTRRGEAGSWLYLCDRWSPLALEESSYSIWNLLRTQEGGFEVQRPEIRAR